MRAGLHAGNKSDDDGGQRTRIGAASRSREGRGRRQIGAASRSFMATARMYLDPPRHGSKSEQLHAAGRVGAHRCGVGPRRHRRPPIAMACPRRRQGRAG